MFISYDDYHFTTSASKKPIYTEVLLELYQWWIPKQLFYEELQRGKCLRHKPKKNRRNVVKKKKKKKRKEKKLVVGKILKTGSKWQKVRVVQSGKKGSNFWLKSIESTDNQTLKEAIYKWRCPCCNGYRRRKWTWRYEFKSWTRLIAFHIALIPSGKVWIQLFSLQANSRFFSLNEATSLGEGKLWIQTC